MSTASAYYMTSEEAGAASTGFLLYNSTRHFQWHLQAAAAAAAAEAAR